ncbi:hypothetical protein FM101_06460 [Arthrobacter rhombi]|uniref:Uncharacterized protein n=1 Tax=Arthrobacter rhombi TaxID=71253 RepID=A0A1R4FXP5_9MICC|nr:hypothetical protein FM101_06460 [Arthrobacter rhombi]
MELAGAAINKAIALDLPIVLEDSDPSRSSVIARYIPLCSGQASAASAIV